jgi:hypothetical protein
VGGAVAHNFSQVGSEQEERHGLHQEQLYHPAVRWRRTPHRRDFLGHGEPRQHSPRAGRTGRGRGQARTDVRAWWVPHAWPPLSGGRPVGQSACMPPNSSARTCQYSTPLFKRPFFALHCAAQVQALWEAAEADSGYATYQEERRRQVVRRPNRVWIPGRAFKALCPDYTELWQTFPDETMVCTVMKHLFVWIRVLCGCASICMSCWFGIICFPLNLFP